MKLYITPKSGICTRIIIVTKNTLLYGHVGAAFNQIEVKNHTNADIESFSTGLIDSTAFAFNETDNVVGLRLGLGIEQKVTCQFSVNADYVYTDYGSVNAAGVNSSPLGDIGINAASSADVKTQALMVGFNFYPYEKDCD